MQEVSAFSQVYMSRGRRASLFASDSSAVRKPDPDLCAIDLHAPQLAFSQYYLTFNYLACNKICYLLHLFENIILFNFSNRISSHSN